MPIIVEINLPSEFGSTALNALARPHRDNAPRQAPKQNDNLTPHDIESGYHSELFLQYA